MARKRKLDPYTSLFIDRHGKERCRFRRNGLSLYLPHPSAKGYRAAYDEALGKAKGLIPLQPRCKPGTVSDLLPRFYESVGFKKGGYDWRRTRKAVLEAFREEFGDDPVAAFRSKDISAILARKLDKADGKGGTHAAKRLREQLDLLFRFAVRQEWITSNPVENAEEIEHKPKASMPGRKATSRNIGNAGRSAPSRLALELMLWTGARRGDARLLPPPKERADQGQGGKDGQDVRPSRCSAAGRSDRGDARSRPDNPAGHGIRQAVLGRRVRQLVPGSMPEAGLARCTAHGLRKALARRAADQGVQQQGLKALGQWSGIARSRFMSPEPIRRRLAESALGCRVRMGTGEQHWLTLGCAIV
jgi:hypothetical protein